MKKKCSRLIAVVLAALFLVAMFPMDAMASSEIVGDGQMGDNVWWTLTADGVLTVSGTGATWSYKDPWSAGVWEEKKPGYRNSWRSIHKNVMATKLVITDGVTAIGDCVFGVMDWLVSVEMADSVKEIGENAFWSCASLTDVKLSQNLALVKACAFENDKKISTIALPASLSRIDWFAFFGCGFTDVYYAGTEAQWKQIQIDNRENGNSPLFNAKIHYNYGAPDNPSAWAKTEVNVAIATGLVPENLQQNYQVPVSRGEVATMFVNLLEQSSGENIATIMAEKNVAPNSGAFTDTSDSAVLAANALGIINGTGNGKFDPGGTLTRAQIAAIINRVANVMGGCGGRT